MIGRILDFRLRQIIRLFKEIGAIYIVLLILVCLGFFLGLVEALIRSETMLMGLIGIMIIASVHFSRKDAGFLRMLELDRKKLYVAEYILLTLPMAIAYLVGGNFGAILFQTIGVLFIAMLPNPEISSHSFTNRLDLNFLPKAAFEAKSQLRRFAIPLGLLYIICLLTSKFLTVAIVFILLIALFFTSFFDEVEGKDLLEAIHFKSGILTAKVKTYLGLYYLLCIPFMVSFFIFHLEYWYLLLAVLFLGSTVILFNIFYKYAHYGPHRRKVYNSMANSIFFGSILIPFFYPITLLYLIFYWRKARKNIRMYYAED